LRQPVSTVAVVSRLIGIHRQQRLDLRPGFGSTVRPRSTASDDLRVGLPHTGEIHLMHVSMRADVQLSGGTGARRTTTPGLACRRPARCGAHVSGKARLVAGADIDEPPLTSRQARKRG
jgi:hypothetical protein